MKVLFIRPSDPLSNVKLLTRVIPLNIGYLASFLKRYSIEVDFLDLDQSESPEVLLEQKIIACNPDIAALSCMTPTIINGNRISGWIKSIAPSVITVVGGAHANCLPLATMKEFKYFDFLIFGEGEVTLLELVRRIESKTGNYSDILGLVYRKDGEVLQNNPRPLIEDIDTLPFPDRELLGKNPVSSHITRGISNSVRAAPLFTSRGCPFPCTFCAIANTFGRTVRLRSPSNIDGEIRFLKQKYSVDHISINDDTFSIKEDRAVEICNVLKANQIKSWNCDTRVSSVTPALFKAMKQSGCVKISVGVESGSQRVLDCMKKKITVEQVESAVIYAKEAGIRFIEGTFIIGADPSETMEDIDKTIRLIKRLPFNLISCSIIVPFPSTEIYSIMKERSLIDHDISWEDFVMFGRTPKWHTEHFSAVDLVQLQKKVTKSFYLNPAYILRQLAGIRSFSEVKYWFDIGLEYIKWMSHK